MENQNIDPKEKDSSLESAFEGNVDATNFGGSQNEDQDQSEETNDDDAVGTLEGKDYSKEGKNLDGQDFDTDESTGGSALENDASASNS